MEGDPVKIMHRMPIRVISTHALRMEGDTTRPSSGSKGGGFLPTPSAWRATKPLSISLYQR